MNLLLILLIFVCSIYVESTGVTETTTDSSTTSTTTTTLSTTTSVADYIPIFPSTCFNNANYRNGRQPTSSGVTNCFNACDPNLDSNCDKLKCAVYCAHHTSVRDAKNCRIEFREKCLGEKKKYSCGSDVDCSDANSKFNVLFVFLLLSIVAIHFTM
mmetsp:Transcript_15117/g.25988  ORF Transcript_15117/g.25988 Transcript_15117/m.25988 type:complete len:157 (+) Transcript_15117:34-504(+)